MLNVHFIGNINILSEILTYFINVYITLVGYTNYWSIKILSN